MHKFLFILIGVTFLLGAKRGHSQDLPVYNQFYFNPFLYNPAFVGSNGGTEINTVLRQQWLGVDDAPISGTLTLQYAGESNLRLGLTVIHESAVILENNAALLTVGYRLPLGYNHSLTFGLSGGIGKYGLDLSQVDLSDPALSNALSSTLYADGNFGFMYQLNDLKLSFAANNIFDANPYSQENFRDIKFSNLESIVGSVSYRFQFVNNPITFEPYLLYRSSGPDFRQAEAAGVFYYQDKFWLGGAYRYESNPAIFVGFNLFRNLKLSYSFEFPPKELNSFRGGSHELMFSYNFGRKSKKNIISENVSETTLNEYQAQDSQQLSAETPVPKEENKKDVTVEEEKAHDSVYYSKTEPKSNSSIESPENYHIPTDSVIGETSPKANDSLTSELVNNEVVPLREIEGVPVLSKGYYVVTGVFNHRENAEKFIAKMADQGFLFKLAINPENQFYYVYKLSTDNLLEARYTKSIYNKMKQFNDVWVYKVE
ncbi:hypothetical protein GCM10011506_29340 [Marivirga lumbricoides]|uniref:SPOR domain-containing protein n=1 Tax=Marivirga lumbricoides TaxID=1046115 RepID=A0ABQ1MJX9_9BACT|nr:hypothetical protein GCM10011506_29340 [Marivirga lumbricoides]